MKMPFLTAVFLLLPLLAMAEDGWKDYVNARFGFKISYPSTLIASADPTNGGGREFHTKDKEFRLATSAHFLHDDTLNSMWQKELNLLGAGITYKRKDKNWFVVSGVNEGVEFYYRVDVKDGNFASFQITYPHAKGKQYDPWVEKIAKTFVPFLKGDYDRIK